MLVVRSRSTCPFDQVGDLCLRVFDHELGFSIVLILTLRWDGAALLVEFEDFFIQATTENQSIYLPVIYSVLLVRTF